MSRVVGTLGDSGTDHRYHGGHSGDGATGRRPGDLLVPSWRDAAMNAESVFARLRTALDPDHAGDVIVRAVAGDGHKPEATGQWVSADAIAQASAALPAAPVVGATLTDTPAVLRLLDAPEEVQVEVPHGAPDAVWWRGRRLEITDVDGPERLTGDWWRADAFARDYWRCVTPTDGELLLYQESDTWWMHGWYD